MGVYHIDRFSRNPAHYCPLIDRLETQGGRLVAPNDPEYDATDPGHEMKRGIDITVALYQARLSRAKMIDVVRRKLESGQRNLGQRVPYGLARNKDETSLVHDPKISSLPARRLWPIRVRLPSGGRNSTPCGPGLPTPPSEASR